MYLTSQVHNVNIALDEDILGEVLGVPTEVFRSLKDESGFKKLLKYIGNLDDLIITNVIKKSLTGKF